MGAHASEELTNLLVAWKGGDGNAVERLMPLVYKELRRIAEFHLRRERRGHTLQPTALINEAYVRLVQSNLPDWENRVHFFAVASKTMRQVLVDWARRNQADKRGGKEPNLVLNEALAVADDKGSQLLALDDALNTLAQFDERGCRAVEMKYFGGLSLAEIAEALEISVATVTRDLRTAEAFLKRELATPKS